jgi:hypothetical protein
MNGRPPITRERTSRFGVPRYDGRRRLPFIVGVNTVVVPRSIFLDSRLRKDFDGGTFAP